MSSDEQAAKFLDGVAALAKECGIETHLVIVESPPDDAGGRHVLMAGGGEPEFRAMLAARLYGAMRESLEASMADAMAKGRQTVRARRGSK